MLALETAIAETQATSQASARRPQRRQSMVASGLRARGAGPGLGRVLRGRWTGHAASGRRVAALGRQGASRRSSPLDRSSPGRTISASTRSTTSPTCCRAHSPRPPLRCTGIGARATSARWRPRSRRWPVRSGELYAERYFPPAQKARVAGHHRERRGGVPRARRARRRGCRRRAGRSPWPSSTGCTSASDTRTRGRTGAIFASTPTTRLAMRSGSPTATIVALWRDARQPYDPHEWVLRRRPWARS